MKDDLLWKITLDRRRPLMEDERDLETYRPSDMETQKNFQKQNFVGPTIFANPTFFLDTEICFGPKICCGPEICFVPKICF